MGGRTVGYITDHEPHSRYEDDDLAIPPQHGTHQVHQEDQRHVAFLAGCDLVIHDAQYTLEEYAKKVADFNSLPALHYAFVRGKVQKELAAKKM